MSSIKVIVFFVFITFSNTLCFAQSDFAVLEKNVNVQAKGLIQELNSSKDTLILKSNHIIQKVYAVNMNYEREVDINVRNNSIQIPLNTLSRGKHVFVAVQSPYRIVFTVKILGDHKTLAVLEDKIALKNE